MAMLLRLTLAVGLTLATASASPAGQAAPLTQIVVAPIGSTDMTPFFYALQQGMFKKVGLDVTVQQVPSGASSMTAVVAGAAQIGFSNVLAFVDASRVDPTRDRPLGGIPRDPGELSSPGDDALATSRRHLATTSNVLSRKTATT